MLCELEAMAHYELHGAVPDLKHPEAAADRRCQARLSQADDAAGKLDRGARGQGHIAIRIVPKLFAREIE